MVLSAPEVVGQLGDARGFSADIAGGVADCVWHGVCPIELRHLSRPRSVADGYRRDMSHRYF